jgi:hypothetical protein
MLRWFVEAAMVIRAGGSTAYDGVAKVDALGFKQFSLPEPPDPLSRSLLTSHSLLRAHSLAATLEQRS